MGPGERLIGLRRRLAVTNHAKPFVPRRAYVINKQRGDVSSRPGVVGDNHTRFGGETNQTPASGVIWQILTGVGMWEWLI